MRASDEKYVRQVIKDAFGGNGRTFQWVRHSANFLLKMFLKSTPTPSLPVFKLFGHSQKTDESYAVEKLSGFMPENCTNTTDVRLILESYWNKINLHSRINNPMDQISCEESEDESESESDDMLDESEDTLDESSDCSSDSQNESDSDESDQDDSEEHEFRLEIDCLATGKNASLVDVVDVTLIYVQIQKIVQ